MDINSKKDIIRIIKLIKHLKIFPHLFNVLIVNTMSGLEKHFDSIEHSESQHTPVGLEAPMEFRFLNIASSNMGNMTQAVKFILQI